MTDAEIDAERISEADRRLLESSDYIVSAGEVYQPVLNDFEGNVVIKELDEIPPEYWERHEHD